MPLIGGGAGDPGETGPGQTPDNKPDWLMPVFVALWLLAALIPAGLAELTSDEGYYWFISRRLEWGYYDHPPILAVTIALSHLLAPGELGVRLINVLSLTATVALALGLMPQSVRVRRIGMLLLASVPLLSYFSILVFPDGPLLLLMTAYLYGYRRFLRRPDAAAVALIGLTSGLMLYAKYHGLLVMAFTIASNLKLLRSPRFMGAMALGAAIFLPHLWWQYQHDFVTFAYHLQGRASGFSADHVFQFVSQQLYTLGPAALLVPFVVRARDGFEKTLRFIAAGTLGFFLLMSLRGLVHAHWTSIAIIPALILGAGYYSRWRHLALALITVPFLVAGLLFRVYLSYPIIPQNHVGIDYYHGRKLWAEDLAVSAGQRPVVFPSNFREAPLYQFYSGNLGVALFPGGERESQYQIWQYEDSLQGREVVWAADAPIPASSPVATRMGPTKHLVPIADFRSYYDLELEVSLSRTAPDTVRARLALTNHRTTPVEFPPGPSGKMPTLFVLVSSSDGSAARIYPAGQPELTTVPPGAVGRWELDVPTGSLGPGSYSWIFGIEAEPMGRSHNSRPVPITIPR